MTLLGGGEPFPSMQCDYPLGCPQRISLPPVTNIDEMRSQLAAHGWRMDTQGDLVHDGISGEDLIGYKTFCPQHKT